MEVKIEVSDYYRSKNPAFYHCIDLDFLRWPGKSWEEEDTVRRSIHEKLQIENICHIFRQSVYCNCPYTKEEYKPEHKIRFLDREEK